MTIHGPSNKRAHVPDDVNFKQGKDRMLSSTFARLSICLVVALAFACSDSREGQDSAADHQQSTESPATPTGSSQSSPTQSAPPVTPTPAKFEPGSSAVLVHPTASGISLRLTPSQTSVTFGRMPIGSVVVITRGPQVAEGVEWCQFRAGDAPAWTECRFLQPQ